MNKLQVIIIGVSVLLLVGCKKNDELKDAPVANAGPDQIINSPTCEIRQVQLDGTASTDPNPGTSLSFSWTKISGPSVTFIDGQSARPTVLFLVGQYSFELTVVNQKGLSSKDTVVITTTDGVKEYDLNEAFSGPYTFSKKYEDCYYRPCFYYDLVSFTLNTTSSTLGTLSLYVYENSDTAASSNNYNCSISIYNNNNNITRRISGYADINFKKLIERGGGNFAGRFTVNSGTALQCGIQLQSLAPLTITGNVNVNTSAMTITIKGKTFL